MFNLKKRVKDMVVFGILSVFVLIVGNVEKLEIVKRLVFRINV